MDNLSLEVKVGCSSRDLKMVCHPFPTVAELSGGVFLLPHWTKNKSGETAFLDVSPEWMK